MSELLVEIHVPLVPLAGEAHLSWIDDVEELLSGVEDEGRGEVYDDGEEFGNEYLFFVWNAPESDLLGIAREVAQLSGVPAGVYARVTDTGADMGEGRRVDL